MRENIKADLTSKSFENILREGWFNNGFSFLQKQRYTTILMNFLFCFRIRSSFVSELPQFQSYEP